MSDSPRLLASKLPEVGTTIFSIMSALATEHRAINLSQGFPDFEPPPGLLRALTNRLASGGHHQYPPMHGITPLREQISAKIERLYGVSTDIDREITITSGATEAIFVAIQSVVSQGDEVILFDPAYDAYAPAVRLAGGIPKHIPLLPPRFEVDLERLAKTVGSKTRLIVINTPHNPTGSVMSRQALETLGEITERFGCYVLADEVYEHMVFDGKHHESALGIDCLKARSFVVSSFGKTYHATGWKIAYCIAPKDLTAEFRKVHQFVTFTTHTPSQWAIADFMVNDEGHIDQLSDFYQKKRDHFLATFSPLAFTLTPSQGTYFQLADYSGIPAIRHLPDVECAELLTKAHGVAAIPLSVFYAEPPRAQRLLRFCFAKDDSTIAEAANRLALGFGITSGATLCE